MTGAPGRSRAAAARLLLALLLTCTAIVSGQSRPPAAEHEVRAAFLYQFARYVNWPNLPGTSTPFVICVFGEDPFGSALDDAVKGKHISDRPVAIKRIIGPAEMRECKVLFVSRSADDSLAAILKALTGQQVLTVGEGPQFTRRGGIVAFTFEDRKVRFIINLAAARAAQLNLSSQLIRIAVRVEQ
jgi:hypothetical protein